MAWFDARLERRFDALEAHRPPRPRSLPDVAAAQITAQAWSFERMHSAPFIVLVLCTQPGYGGQPFPAAFKNSPDSL